MKDFNYLVLDRCRLSYDMTLYEMMKKHFENDNIKIVLVVDASNENFGYWVEIRKVVQHACI